MDQRASVEGHLSRLKHVVVGLTVSLGIRYFLMEDEIPRGFSPFQFTEKVAFGNEAHGGIGVINVIDGQPNGHGFRGPDGPIGCILVPRHVLGFLCELAEVVGRPANKIGTKKIFNVVQNARMLCQVPYALAVILVTHDRVSVAAVVVRFDPGEQVIEVATIGTHLGWRECVQRADITQFVELHDLCPAQGFGLLRGYRKKFDVLLPSHLLAKTQPAFDRSVRWFMTKSDVAPKLLSRNKDDPSHGLTIG